MKEWQKAYLAGFLDADGTICLQKGCRAKGNYQYYPRVCVYNTHKPTVQIIQSWYTQSKLDLELQSPSKGMRKKLYRLYIKGKDLKKVLHDTIPYLLMKKESAKICLEFLELDRTIKRDKYGRIKPLLKKQVKERELLWKRFRKAIKVGKEPYEGQTIGKW